MEQKTVKNTSKKKLPNHLTKNGQKEIIEKIIIKSSKQIQKYNKKNYNEIIKLSRLNTLPAFKTIKLTNNKRRKKSIKEIPMFISSNKYRTTWGLKYLIKTKQYRKLIVMLENEIILSSKHESSVVEYKNDLQNKASKEKKYFRYYRW